ncbi:MAG: phosphoribosylamine--glycine ligase [Phycisphaerae bacterium]
MNVLVLGGGGREHALCWSLLRAPSKPRLFILPGNGGTALLGTNIAGDPSNVKLALEVARREDIDLTIVGSEEPLAAGIVDAFQAAGLRVFGPSRQAARLESDKSFAKQLMRQQALPTADARVFTDYRLAHEYIAARDEPLVIKAAGLCKGKGVVVCSDPAEALLWAERMLAQRVFGEAGAKIVVEERLVGREASVLAIVDGSTLLMLEPAQDYKRVADDDAGANTGGMGAVCPTDALDAATLRQVESQIFVPILDGLLREDVTYRGVLYAGLILTHAGPKVLEFNCRFGDPETQVVLMRLQSDLLELLDAATRGTLDQADVRWDPRAAVCVVLASGGYPGEYATNVPISGADDDFGPDVAIFHAGTRRDARRVVTTGGRVLGVTALGETREAARARAYAAAERIAFDGRHYRRDIGAASRPRAAH